MINVRIQSVGCSTMTDFGCRRGIGRGGKHEDTRQEKAQVERVCTRQLP